MRSSTEVCDFRTCCMFVVVVCIRVASRAKDFAKQLMVFLLLRNVYVCERSAPCLLLWGDPATHCCRWLGVHTRSCGKSMLRSASLEPAHVRARTVLGHHIGHRKPKPRGVRGDVLFEPTFAHHANAVFHAYIIHSIKFSSAALSAFTFEWRSLCVCFASPQLRLVSVR
jgi:hypothetical protein